MSHLSPSSSYAVGSLVRARGREWVVQPGSEPDFLLLQPLGGGLDDLTGLHTSLEQVTAATFPLPAADDLGDARSAALLRTALRLGFRSTAGPFRSVGALAVQPRAYQLVPLMLALRQPIVRLLIADDVGIGKTVEAGLIASELLAQGDIRNLAVLCSPALAEQWQQELREKFLLDATLVLTSTASALERGLMMDESIFDRHPVTVVSTDFIKSPVRRDEFLARAPELIIVDEAHTCVADNDTPGRSRHQRYDLMRELAADPDRHLVLVTATPHSGKDEGFRNLIALLRPELATVDLDTSRGRETLAAHMVQRRRKDIRTYLEEETAFPADRETLDVPYSLTPAYRTVFEATLDHARAQIRDPAGGQLRQRIRWWSALALLRALASSPAAAAQTLRTRASSAYAADLAEADALGRAGVLDTADDEALDGVDVTPGGDALDDSNDDADAGRDTASITTRDARSPESGERAALRALARQVQALEGPKADAKLALLIRQVKDLLSSGYDPIVFCRFIDTATYVAEHLSVALGASAKVAAVTGVLPPAERITRIGELTDTAGRHVLVATDCLSEGVNLQEHFQAVVHYDLAWNPTRHEQREGRVDRFGQRANTTRALTLYGRDNQIDGIVLDVLIRRHRRISATTGVSVPVPDQSDSVLEALLEGLLLRGSDAEQLELDLDMRAKTAQLHDAWQSAAAKERDIRTKYQHAGLRPDVVAAEVAAMRAALGDPAEIEPFVRQGLAALGADVSPTGEGFVAATSTLQPSLRDALPPRRPEPIPFHRDLPAPPRAALLTRTDPYVATLARHVLEVALDPPQPGVLSPARRAGIIRTSSVQTRTTVLLVRFRFHVSLPSRTHGMTQLVAEDCGVLAFTGAPDRAVWLPEAQALALLDALPEQSIPADQARATARSSLERLSAIEAQLAAAGQARSAELAASHARVRAGSGEIVRGLNVRPEQPVDIVGVYVYLPALAVGAGTESVA